MLKIAVVGFERTPGLTALLLTASAALLRSRTWLGDCV